MDEHNIEVPVWEKFALTLEEAAKYYGIGINKLRTITNENNSLVIMNGNRRLIKRKKLEQYLEKQYVI